MRLKCIDGKVREFEIAGFNIVSGKWDEGACLQCGYLFGVHDTRILRPLFKKHVCEPKRIGDG